MKFMKFGKALLMSALSAGVILSVTSCTQSYTVGFLYVTGTYTDSSTSTSGYITAYGIDHNTGRLSIVHGMPVSSGGANPVRAVLAESGRFLYVLNRGTTSSGSSDCTTSDPCQDGNITLFSVSGNGALTAQTPVYSTQGTNPFRMIIDTAGTHLYVLDHDAPDSSKCALVFSSATSCGDITAFTIDTSTGRLSTVTDAQVTSETLAYFPVPANPVDFVLYASYIFTLSASTAQTSYPYTGGATAFPYTYTSSTGQLSVSSNSSQSLSIAAGTAIVSAGSYVYVLDDEAPSTSVSTTATSQILAYTVSSGMLAAATTPAIAGDASQNNPIALTLEAKGKWFYVANEGDNNTTSGTTYSGITGYIIESPFEPQEIDTFTTGTGPQCLVEDPSDQFFYTANSAGKTISGLSLDANAGTLTPLSSATHAASSYSLSGPATWCLVTGRSS